MSDIKMYRKRFIPDETVDISGDEILYRDDDVLITKWFPIKPRKDFDRGISFTFLKKEYKISTMILSPHQFVMNTTRRFYENL